MVNKYRLLINMAPFSCELKLQQKEIMIQLSNEGYSSPKIQDLIGINSRTIQKNLKRVRKRGSRENLLQSGRKKNNSAR